MHKIIVYIVCCVCLVGTAQNITIKGKAHASHIGKEIVLYDYSDYITYNKIKESVDTIDANGYFELKLQSKITKLVLLSIDNLNSKLYVQPKFIYGIYYPEKNNSTYNNQTGTESFVNLTIYGNDSTELNALTTDFNTQYNAFLIKSSQGYVSPTKINQTLDSFAVYSNKRYKAIKNSYFKHYVNYSFANFFSNTSRSKTLLYKQFLEHKPILYHNYEYMEFFNTQYTGYFKAFASTKTGGSIYNSINSFADYQDLWNQFKTDKHITNDTLLELIVLKGLYESYFSPDFEPTKVQSVIEQMQRITTIEEHQLIASNILNTIHKLQPGANSPDFTAENKNGEVVSLSSFKGKYIYLNFFSLQSENSLKEMSKIMDLKKKFNDKVTFISVCLDDSSKIYKVYLKANPKFDWVILHQTKNKQAQRAFNLQGLSGFYFINQQLQLVQSPALAPSEGIEYKFNALFKAKKKNTIVGIR